MNNSNQIIEIGQRVHCILYGGKDGTVYGIHGEQRPETIKSLLGGFMTSGGFAMFDIVWDNGTSSPKVPESILRGVQWSILDEELENAQKIAERLAFAEKTKRERESAEAEHQRQLEARRQQIKADNPHLQQSEGRYGSAKLGAANLRKELKKAFPKVKFSVRSSLYSGGDSIDIHWDLGPSVKEVEAITGKYQEGNFNGMEDIYETNRDNVWPDIFGGAKYVSEIRHIPESLQLKLIEEFCKLANCTGEGWSARFGVRSVNACLDEILNPFTVPVGDSIIGLRHGNEGEMYIMPVLASEKPKEKARLRYNHTTGALVPVH